MAGYKGNKETYEIFEDEGSEADDQPQMSLQQQKEELKRKLMAISNKDKPQQKLEDLPIDLSKKTKV